MPKMVGAILVGGRSQRLEGGDKTRLHVHGERLIVRLADLLKPWCDECVLIGREEQLPEFEALGVGEGLADLYPGCGPFGGLYTVLEDRDEDVFLVACDMPYLTPSLLERLVLAYRMPPISFGALFRVPDAGQYRLEPLCSIWSRQCRRPANVALEAGERSVSAFARSMNLRAVDLNSEEAGLLASVNFRRDLEGLKGSIELPEPA